MTLPHLGEMVGEYSDWTPLDDGCHPFGEKGDRTDPWQFVNIRVDWSRFTLKVY